MINVISTSHVRPAVLSFKPHPKSLSRGEGLLPPSPLEKGWGSDLNNHITITLIQHDALISLLYNHA